MPQGYDPLNYENLARSVVNALLENDVSPLPPDAEFGGCGVYAIYYMGKLPFYAGIASKHFKAPIYVGKAVPKGARKGTADGTLSPGKELFDRLCEHGVSIQQTRNLALEDFRCRYLVVVPVWITLAERFLIDHFRLLWNTVVDGFGNHNPGKGRIDMRRPRWDILHAGRPWAERLAAAETPEQVIALIEAAKK